MSELGTSRYSYLEEVLFLLFVAEQRNPGPETRFFKV